MEGWAGRGPRPPARGPGPAAESLVGEPGAILAHARSLALYYFGRTPAEFESRHGLAQSLGRLLRLNEGGEVAVRQPGPDEVVIARTAGGGASYRGGARIAPVFVGQLQVRNGSVILAGRFALDFMVRLVVGVVGFFACLYFPLAILFGTARGAFPGAGVVAILFLLLAELGYGAGRGDIAVIARNVQQALQSD